MKFHEALLAMLVLLAIVLAAITFLEFCAQVLASVLVGIVSTLAALL